MKVLLADYVLPITASPIEKGAVVIEGDKIKAVGSQAEIKKIFPNAQTRDFGQSVLMPGFVNVHSHLELTIMRNVLSFVENDFLKWLLTLTKIRRHLTEEEIKTSAIIGAVEGIKSGVTCFADVGNLGKAGFEALKLFGLRGIVYQETNFSPFASVASADFETLREKFLALRQDETPLVRAGISPHAPYTVSSKLFEKIAQYALDQNVPIMIHTAESRDEVSFLLNGEGVFAEIYDFAKLKYQRSSQIEHWAPPKKRVIPYLQKTGILSTKPLLAHCVQVTDEEIDCIRENQCKIAHCPRSNARFGHGIAPLLKFLEAGIPTGLGTDSVASCGSCDILQEGATAVLLSRLDSSPKTSQRRKFIKPEEVIKLATIGGACALGLEKEIGSLEVGKQADLIAIRLDSIWHEPVKFNIRSSFKISENSMTSNDFESSDNIYSCLLFTSSSRDVCFTMVAGQELYSDGKLLKLDENELKEKIIKTTKNFQRRKL